MLFSSILLDILFFLIIYPLYFRIFVYNAEYCKKKSYKFHIALVNIIGGIFLIIILCLQLPSVIKVSTLIWKFTLFGISRYFWKRKYPDINFLLIPTSIGIYLFYQFYVYLIIQQGGL